MFQVSYDGTGRKQTTTENTLLRKASSATFLKMNMCLASKGKYFFDSWLIQKGDFKGLAAVTDGERDFT